jgi:hypothetical protein
MVPHYANRHDCRNDHAQRDIASIVVAHAGPGLDCYSYEDFKTLALEESGESTRLIGFSLRIVLVLVASLLCMNRLDGIVADILVAASPDLPHGRI